MVAPRFIVPLEPTVERVEGGCMQETAAVLFTSVN